MEKLNPSPKQHIHLQIDVDMYLPMHTVLEINQECIQEAITKLLQNNPQALIGNSPEDILKNLNISIENRPRPKGKWAKIAQNIEEHAMGEKAALEFNQGRQKFRETFGIGDIL